MTLGQIGKRNRSMVFVVTALLPDYFEHFGGVVLQQVIEQVWISCFQSSKLHSRMIFKFVFSCLKRKGN